MRIFLGITYQLYLEDNDFKLTLGLWNQKRGNPIDPFWENFSTENLRNHADGLGDADEKKTVMNLTRFGTLYQPLDTAGN